MAVLPPRRWSATQVRRSKPVIWASGLYPLASWIYLAMQDALTANPPEYLIRSTGVWALVFLWLTLALSPLARFSGQPALIVVRRLLGLFCFFYTVLHIIGWALWERGLSLSLMLTDIGQRPFILIGTVASLLLLALAATSTQAAMRRLGRRWKTLHRTIYLIAVLSLWHYWLVKAGKQDFQMPLVHMGVFGVLMLTRAGRMTRRQPTSPSATHRSKTDCRHK
ncbi:MAG TPA: protein-methionine-sulfoxide reductase heme-binding subunit MsrQ [Burkholderiaceae bacterium]|nr:protein-methionine-sulfoxide reductase heme-binding subunit MsrQ [Burkholderiaceae bacterium]